MKISLRSLPIYFLTFIYSITLYASEEGSLIVRNFNATEYAGGSKIYSIVSTTNGFMYAGDKKGVIEFDGENWLKITTGFAINSLAVDRNNQIFVAGKEGIGFLERDSLNQVKYSSLNHLVTGYLNSNVFRNSEVFHIENEILFVVDNKLVVYSDERIRIIENAEPYKLAQVVDNELYLYASKSGLFKYTNGEISPVITSDTMKFRSVWGLMKTSKGLMIWEKGASSFLVTEENLIQINTKLNEFIRDHVVQRIQQIDSNTYVLKTFYDGLLLVNRKGEIIKHINQKGGLINNTVFAADSDQFGNLWVGTSAGISVFRQDLSFTKYNNQLGIGTGYSAAKIKDDLYLGTSHGVWKKELNTSDDNEFELLFSGHVFGLSVVDDILYLGHPSGIYSIEKGKMKAVIPIPGGSSIKKVPFEKNQYLSNTFNGLLVFKQDVGSKLLEYSHLIDGKNRVNHNFEFDTLGNVWTEYDNGIYTFNWNKPELKRYYTRVGRENRIKKVRRIENQLYFIADSGVYFFDNNTEKFYKPSMLKGLNGNEFPVTNIVANSSKQIWVFAGGQLSQYQISNNTFYRSPNQPFKFIDGTYPPDFENVFSLSDSSSLIGSEEGFYHYKNNKFSHGTYSSVIIRKVGLSSHEDGKQSIWGSITEKNRGHSLSLTDAISYTSNSIEFTFAAGSPNYNKVYYQTYLDGYNTKWSEWSRDNNREFTNLPAGNYRFVVRAINDSEEYSEIAVCEFEILPPWYLTTWMKVVYAISIILIFIVVIFLIRFTISREKKRIARKQKLDSQRTEQKRIREKLTTEKELVTLRNEKLRSDNLHKSKELANLTLSLIQKNQVLTEFRGELDQIRIYAESNKIVTEDLRRLIKRVNRDIDKEENWEVFENYFDTVHENFFIKLKKKFPDLSSKDLRLCAYLRMNLATKEIAPLMNITVRGVEIGRYRLRRKLELERNVNFTSFLNNL